MCLHSDSQHQIQVQTLQSATPWLFKKELSFTINQSCVLKHISNPNLEVYTKQTQYQSLISKGAINTLPISTSKQRAVRLFKCNINNFEHTGVKLEKRYEEQPQVVLFKQENRVTKGENNHTLRH